MGEPYFYPDNEMLSECCGAVSATEIVNSIGICNSCREWAEFSSEEEYDEEENEGD